MKNHLLLFFLFTVSCCLSQDYTIIPGGNISGILSLAESPYRVTADLEVKGGATLVIEEGVEIRFDPGTALTINGRLIAEGNPDSTIVFTSFEEGNRWTGIIFLDSSIDDSKITNAKISQAENGIYLRSAFPMLKDLELIGNKNGIFGNSNMGSGQTNFFSHIVFKENEVGFWGDWTFNSEIKDCTFLNNGTGVMLEDHVGEGDSLLFERCLIHHNDIGFMVEADRRNTILRNCTISDNIFEEVIVGMENSTHGVVKINIENCILWGGAFEDGIVLVSLNEVSINHSNVKLFSGVFEGEGNMNKDPGFVDSAAGNYHLSPNSPCLDAGNPESPLDPDSTIADMGAFYFDQTFFADFSSDIRKGLAPLTVRFSDVSLLAYHLDIDNWIWDFGDGNTSEEQNPIHTYTRKGTYDVTLTISNENFTNTKTFSDFVEVLNSPPKVNTVLNSIEIEEDHINTDLDLSHIFLDPDNDTLSFSHSQPTNLNISIEISGKVTIIPIENWFGRENIIFTASDTDNESSSFSLEIIVTSVNDQPKYKAISPDSLAISILEGNKVSFLVEAEDVDNAIDYSWFINGVKDDQADKNSFEYLFSESGNYSIQSIISDGTVNIDTTWRIIVDQTSGLKNQNYPKHVKSVRVFPNPVVKDAVGTIELSVSKRSKLKIEIWNMEGKKLKSVYNGIISSGETSYLWNRKFGDAHGLQPGSYFLKMIIDNEAFVRKVIVL